MNGFYLFLRILADEMEYGGLGVMPRRILIVCNGVSLG
jgi:hypothetical protein